MLLISINSNPNKVNKVLIQGFDSCATKVVEIKNKVSKELGFNDVVEKTLFLKETP